MGFLVFGEFFNLGFLVNFYAVGQIFMLKIGQMLNKASSHLVALKFDHRQLFKSVFELCGQNSGRS